MGKIAVLPLIFQDYLIEPRGNQFVTDLGKTRLQMLCDTNPPVLPPMPVRHLWENLKEGRIDPQLFYDKELHKPHGAEAGDLTAIVKQLAEEMYDNLLVVNGVFVVSNNGGLVFNLGNTSLPAFITSVGVYTEKPLTPEDQEHGMTLKEFKKTGGKLVVYGAFPAGQYQLKHDERIRMTESIEQIGVIRGDEIHANLDPRHSDGVKSLYLELYRPGDDRPSYLGANLWLDVWFPFAGALRGRRRTLPLGKKWMYR